MVLEAILGEEGFAREADASPPAAALTITGDAPGGREASVRLRIAMLPEYPSHLPPCVPAPSEHRSCPRVPERTRRVAPRRALEIVDGVGVEDAGFVGDALRELFYAQRDESLAADEPAEGILHRWTEWLREEWIASSGGAA